MDLVINLLILALDIYFWIIILTVVVSWLVIFEVLNTRNKWVLKACNLLNTITNPLVMRLRKVISVAVNEIQHWEFADKRPEDEQVKAASYETTSVYGFGHPLYYRNVLDVMRGQAQPEVDGREGLKSLEVLVAAYRSARDGVRVNLPLEL